MATERTLGNLMDDELTRAGLTKDDTDRARSKVWEDMKFEHYELVSLPYGSNDLTLDTAIRPDDVVKVREIIQRAIANVSRP